MEGAAAAGAEVALAATAAVAATAAGTGGSPRPHCPVLGSAEPPACPPRGSAPRVPEWAPRGGGEGPGISGTVTGGRLSTSLTPPPSRLILPTRDCGLSMGDIPVYWLRESTHRVHGRTVSARDVVARKSAPGIPISVLTSCSLRELTSAHTRCSKGFGWPRD